MDNRQRRENIRRRKKLYRRRRIFALVLIIVFFLVITMLIRAIRNDGTQNQEIQNTETQESVSNSISEEFVSNLSKEDILSINNVTQKLENKESLAEIMPFRQERIRDHTMGRITKQSNLSKQIYLTFDDGPSSEATNQILDILKDYNIKATFFVIGQNAQNYPDILRRIYDEGHAIGIHTYDHNYKKIYSSADALQEDIEKCLNALREILGPDFNTNLYRFPGGSFRSNKDMFVERVESLGYIYYDWNALNGDAEGRNPSESYLIDRFNETRDGYNVLISLMHDTNDKTGTVNSLPEIIEELQSEGYQFKSLGEI